MNPERLLAHFDRLAEAPDAIPRLRRFILDLAVRGKLVEQDPTDEPAAELLKRIEEEKARLVKIGEIKNRKISAREGAESLASTCPFGWELSNLGEVALKITDGAHKTPTYVEKGVPFVSVKDFSGGRLDLSSTRFIPESEHAILYQRCDPRRGDILLGRIGTLGKAVLVDTDVEFSLFVSVGLIRFDHENINPEFFRFLLNSPLVEAEFDRIKIGGGTHTNKLNLGDLHTIALPLPPLPEQHRIVAKVDELMALCEQLEAAQAEREQGRGRLLAASLQRLNQPAEDAETFRQHARFALDHLPRLTTRPEQIKPLRQTILNLAVRGRLVAQDPNDEPAAELLQRIAIKRTALLDADYPNPAEARTQKRKQEQQKVPDDLPALPTGWQWATLQQCALMVIDCKNKTAPYSPAGIKLVRTTNVRDGKLNLNDQKYVTEEIYQAWSLRAKPDPGDILITREAPMGEVCIIPEGERLCLGQRMMLARLVPETIDEYFMLYSLRDPDLMERVQDKPLGMTVQHLRVGGVETLLVPLPPLPEQHRIVAKVDELMALCDQLESHLTTTQTDNRRLLEAVLHEALAPALADAA
jgi:type I restriction enzyme S subunit